MRKAPLKSLLIIMKARNYVMAKEENTSSSVCEFLMPLLTMCFQRLDNTMFRIKEEPGNVDVVLRWLPN